MEFNILEIVVLSEADVLLRCMVGNRSDARLQFGRHIDQVNEQVKSSRRCHVRVHLKGMRFRG